MSALSEQLPWQLQQQYLAEQKPDSTGEQASADAATAESGAAGDRVGMPPLRGAPALEVGSFAEQLQQQQQEQELGVFRLTGTSSVFGSSSMLGDVGQVQQQQQQQGLGTLRLTDTSSVFGSSSMEGEVGPGWKGDEETAARAAYRQWSESFEAGKVRAALPVSQPLHVTPSLHTYI